MSAENPTGQPLAWHIAVRTRDVADITRRLHDSASSPMERRLLEQRLARVREQRDRLTRLDADQDHPSTVGDLTHAVAERFSVQPGDVEAALHESGLALQSEDQITTATGDQIAAALAQWGRTHAPRKTWLQTHSNDRGIGL